MIYCRIILAFVLFFFISLFFSFNIKTMDEGVGNIYLAIAAVSLLLIILLSGRYEIFIRIKRSLLWLMIFLFYVVLKLYIDIGEISVIQSYTIGTSRGIVFALLLGLTVSIAISDVYRIAIKKKQALALATALIVFLLALNLLMIIQVFQEDFASVRTDVFLILDPKASYQRAGSLLFMQFMINGSLLVLLFLLIKNKLLMMFATIIYVLIGFVSMAMAQLISSNSGFVTVGGFLFMVIVYIYIVSNKRFQVISSQIKTKFFSRGWLGRKIFTGISIVLIFFCSLFTFLINYYSVDLSRFRIFGFGSGRIDSIDSRIELFRNNFFEHLSYNPFFGNAQVDTLTTGTGTYVHSLFSILTHLGVVGFMLFTVFLTQVYFELRQCKYFKESYSLYSNYQFALFRFLAVSFVLLYAVLTAFYPWMPLWFCIGLFSIALADNHHMQ